MLDDIIQNQLSSKYVKHLKLGLYSSVISAYNSVFGPNHVYLVDGKMLRSDPNGEFGLLLRHFGLDASYMDFRFNQDKGFHCLARPVNYCLKDGKGTTHKFATVYEEFPQLNGLKGFYENEMFKTYTYIYACQTRKHCCQITTRRFQWMQAYFC